MKKTIEVICVSSAFEHLHIRGKDTAGAPLNHKTGQNYYLVEGQLLSSKEQSELKKQCPGIECSRTVSAELVDLVNKTPKLNGVSTVLTAIVIPIEVGQAEVKSQGGAGEAVKPEEMTYQQLKSALGEKGLPVNGDTETLRARLVEALKPE